MAEYDPLPLRSAILGLLYECNGPAQPALIQEWTDLVHAYVLRFAQPSDQPDQLRLLWERVAANLGQEWSLTRLAREAGYSNEHLRRLCQRQMGRSPMHQVTYLRMRHASELLVASSKTIECISQEVGYQNPLFFRTRSPNGSAGGPRNTGEKKRISLGPEFFMGGPDYWEGEKGIPDSGGWICSMVVRGATRCTGTRRGLAARKKTPGEGIGFDSPGICRPCPLTRRKHNEF